MSRLLHRMLTRAWLVLAAALLAIAILSELPWWVGKNLASRQIAFQIANQLQGKESQTQQSAQIVSYLQVQPGFRLRPAAAASLLRYLSYAEDTQKAAGLVESAARSGSPNPLFWYDLALLAESDRQWDLAARAWPKSGFQANVEYSLEGGQVLVLDDFSDFKRWTPHLIGNVPDAALESAADGISIRYSDQPAVREVMSYYLGFHRFICPAGAVLTLQAWSSANSYLTLDAVLDGQAIRLLAYQVGSEGWNTYSFPLPGGVLERILVGLGEPENTQGDGAQRRYVLRALQLSLDTSGAQITP